MCKNGLVCNLGRGLVLDIDECSIMSGVCGKGTCRNTPGNFICDCEEGYESTMMMQVCMGKLKHGKKRSIFVDEHLGDVSY